MNLETQREPFVEAILGWFAANGRDYPWRRTEDPYAILVSELMLQQTQVATVLERGYFVNWLEKFPDVETLAVAEEQEVLKAWEGLGYYNRARNLQKAARAIVDEHGGEFPRDPMTILALPGVGRYTAGAVASFAYNLPEPAVDANIARVLARLFSFEERIDTTSGQNQLWSWAEELVPEKNARDFNSGLMELGQTYCPARVPRCMACPVSEFCAGKDIAESLPRKKERVKTTAVDEHVVWVV
ncbi:MAG: A/G-specific adenine glycosylase, partial [Verrucomicrobiota bacterium]